MLQITLQTQRLAHEESAAQAQNTYHRVGLLRQSLEQFQKQHLDIALQEQQSQLLSDQVQKYVLEKYLTHIETILVDYHLMLPPPDAEQQTTQCKRSIEQLGPIYPNAIEEYENLKKRHGFLSTQSNDLQSALNQLEQAIVQIDQATKQRFMEAFEAINGRFGQVFSKLFRGGRAFLTMTNPNDALTTGVDIHTEPPGKKLTSIALMSGGEKALTATSLIFAIFLLKPSPFCLLDEVDAPLDEANVNRFAQLIKEMSAISQFILITHNKRSMEIADQLYGVTMEEPGISKLVNVRIRETTSNEVQAQA